MRVARFGCYQLTLELLAFVLLGLAIFSTGLFAGLRRYGSLDVSN